MAAVTKCKTFVILLLVVLVSIVTVFLNVMPLSATNWKVVSASSSKYRPIAKHGNYTEQSQQKVVKAVKGETYPNPNWVNAMKSSKSILDIPLKVSPDIEVVVAHYNENLTWLLPQAHLCHIYHKGKMKTPGFRFKRWEILPNVGREGHTYLYHIIDNYKRLADITVFIQGEIRNHQFCYQNIDDYITETLQKGFSVKNHINYGDWSHIHKLQGIRKSKFTFGMFWERVFGTAHPHSIVVSYNACFGVEKKRILKYPKTFYENILSYVNDNSNPEEGHFVERLWTHLFR